MKNWKRLSTLLLAIAMLLTLSACGSARKSENSSAPTPRPEPAAAASGMYYSDSYAAEEAVYDGDYESGFSAVSTAAAPNSGRDSQSDAPDENPDKIIYSADVTVETTEFEETVGKVSGLVEKYGGWIESSSVSGSNYYQISQGNTKTRDASYTLRIPGNRFSALMESLSDLGNIPYSHMYTENVTAQYYDTQARLKAYTTQETRLLEMMELAESVEDVIIIEDRLTELRYKIESLQTSLNNWDRRVSYSTVYLSVKEVLEYTPEEKVEPTYGEELVEALKAGLHNAGQFLKDLLVFLVEVIPVLVILVPIIWLVVWLIRKLKRNGVAKRAARQEARLEKKARAAKEKAEKARAKADETAVKTDDGKHPEKEA